MNNRLFTLAILFALTLTAGALAQDRVKIANGALEGVSDKSTGVRSFKGILFGEPPLGDSRWKPPQPAPNWEGVRKADKFGPRCMQRQVFGDMGFRSNGMSEDCLYLNVWTPAKTDKEKLPVLVYFFGGGFVAGDGSEGRYDGENMAKKGIVAITVNYRLGVFGFFSHPELTKESPHHASGNYGLLDQHAALEWVRQNIAAFGGDPKRVTIAGESAGSIAVSEQMGIKFAGSLGKGDAPSLAELRAMTAEQLLEATAKPGQPWFTATVDGYFFPKSPFEIYAAGEQAHVPLLAGVNSEEMGSFAVLGLEKPTIDNYHKALERLYPGKGEDVFKHYPASNDAEVIDVAQELASDRFISYSTWKWVDMATKTGGKPTYYYLYARPRPAMRPEMGDAQPGLAGGVVRGQQAAANRRPQPRGAVHSAEIEYAMGNLDLNKVYAWTPDDYKVSQIMHDYFANFIKTGNPNGKGLPNWPKFGEGQRIVINVNTRAEADKARARYEFLDQFYVKK